MPETGPGPQHAADAHGGGGFLGGFKSLFGGGKHEAAHEPAPAAEHVEQASDVSQAPDQAPAPAASSSELTDKPSFTDGVVATEPQPLDLSGAAVSQPTSSEVSHDEQPATDGAQEGEPSEKESPESAMTPDGPTAENAFNLDPIAHAEQEHNSAADGTGAHEDTPTEAEPATFEVTPTEDEATEFLKKARAAAASGNTDVTPVDAEATPVARDVTVVDGTVEPIAPHSESETGTDVEVQTPGADAVIENEEHIATPTSEEEPPPAAAAEGQDTPEGVTAAKEGKSSEEDFPVPVMPIEEKAPTDDAEPSVTVDREATVIPDKLGDETPATEEIQAEKDPAQPSAEALAPVIDLRPALAKLNSMQDDLSALRTSIQEAIDKQKAA